MVISLPKISCSKIGKQKQLEAKPGDVPLEVGGRLSSTCGPHIHVLINGTIVQTEDDIEHHHFPDPIAAKVNKVRLL